MKFIYYPTKPFFVSQRWGLKNSIYKQFGFEAHNGLDTHLPKDKIGHAPFEGIVVRIGNQPKGGGVFVGLMSNELDFPDGKYRVLVDFLHCEGIIANEGDVLKRGDKLATLDNTGFTTGPHLHTQWRRAKNWNGKIGKDLKWEEVDMNDANNSFDPTPYFTGECAEDSVDPFVNSDLDIIAKELSIIERIIDLIKRFWRR